LLGRLWACLICKIKLPAVWANGMKKKEKIIKLVWLTSVALILLVGIILCLQRPRLEIIEANKEIAKMAENIRAHYRNRPDYWGLNNGEVIKKNLYAGKMNNNQIIGKLNKVIIVGGDAKGGQVMPGQRNFMLGYQKLNRAECEQLASFRWTEESKLGLISLTIENNAGTYEFSWGNKGLPLSRSRAKRHCGEENSIFWTFE